LAHRRPTAPHSAAAPEPKSSECREGACNTRDVDRIGEVSLWQSPLASMKLDQDELAHECRASGVRTSTRSGSADMGRVGSRDRQRLVRVAAAHSIGTDHLQAEGHGLAGSLSFAMFGPTSA